MRIKGLALFLCLFLFSAGCGTTNSQLIGEGYIFEKRDGGVLVLNNVGQEDIGKRWNDIFDYYQGEAIWLRTKASGLEVGQYVKYWVSGPIEDSFPQQASADKIKVVDKD